MNVRDHLQTIYRARGEMTPAVVVEEARPAGSPLHTHFEWDDTVAGEKYRLVQAQELIRSVKVTFVKNDEVKDVRAWVSVSRVDNYREYLPVEEVVQDPFSYRLVLQEMERDIATLERKYGHIEEFHEYLSRVVA